jgi:hypothetical protein
MQPNHKPDNLSKILFFAVLLVFAAGITNCTWVKKMPIEKCEIIAVKADNATGASAEIKAPAYDLVLAADKARLQPDENGIVQFTWNDRYLSIHADMQDTDILATSMQDQMPHYKLGDVLEIFLKPADKDYYWELFATPLGKQTSIFWQKRDIEGDDDGNINRLNMQVSVVVNGTINNSSDIDKGWRADISISLKDMAKLGDAVGPGSKWKILVARQNYSQVIDSGHRELSMTPRLSKTNFHLNEEYAHLIFLEDSTR